MDRRRKPAAYVCLLMIAIAVAAVPGRIWSDDFVHFDDNIHIYNNHLLAPVSPGHIEQFWTQPFKNLYIPLSYMVFAALSLLAHTSSPVPNLTDTGRLLDPRVFHTASLVLHMVNAMMVFTLLKRLVGKPAPALAGALLWALHPLQVESVAWASELRGLLSAFFCLCALLAAIKERDGDENREIPERPAIGRWAGFIVLAVCGMLCKPSAIVLPMLAFVIEVLIQKRAWKPALIRNGVALAALVPFVFITTSAQNAEMPGPFIPTPILRRPLIALDTIGFYIEKLFGAPPFLADYGRRPDYVLEHRLYIGTGILAVVAICAAVVLRRKLPWLAAGGLIMLLDISPVLGLTPFIFQYYSTVGDRYMYLPLLGPAYMAAAALAQWPKRWAYGLFAAVIVAFSGISWRQAGYWKNTDTLFTYVGGENPRSFNAWELLGDDARARGDVQAMQDYYAKEIPAAPWDYRSYNDVGAANLIEGSYDAALSYFRQSSAIRPNSADVYYNMGETYRLMKRYNDAIRAYGEASKRDPADPKALVGIAKTYGAEKDLPNAEVWYQKAIKVSPSFYESYFGMAESLAARQRLPEALDYFAKAQKYNPANGAIALDMGIILDQLGRTPEAVSRYEYAVTYSPQFEPPHVYLGVDLGKMGDFTDAVAQFREALKLNPSDKNAQMDLRFALSSLQASPKN